MNIAVFGWYHHQNAGDDRMQRCLSRWLDGHTLAFLPSGRPPPVEMLRTYDAALIGGGGLISSEGGIFKGMANWVKATGIPVGLVGASIELLTPRLRTELSDFLDVCCFAWFRDQASLDAIGRHPRAFTAPDLTWLFPYSAPANPSGQVALALRRRAGVDLQAWSQALNSSGASFRPWPLYFEGEGDPGVLNETNLFAASEIPSEFDLSALNASSAVASSRYHGLVFGLQCGRPILALANPPKILNFMMEAGLGKWVLGEDQAVRFPDLWRDFESSYEHIAAQCGAVREQMYERAQKKGAFAHQKLLSRAGDLPAPGRRLRNRLSRVLNLGRWV